ncbi:MAG: hypothetical protein HY331_17725, partial [Chloroflexi bacterium]|nr:hypothetical protein [Chloroflexota bacterium]
DVAVGDRVISGFNAVAEELARLEQVRILVGRTARHTLEEIARGATRTPPATVRERSVAHPAALTNQ